MNLTVIYERYLSNSGEQENKIQHFVAASLIYVIGHCFVGMANNFVLTITSGREHTCVFYNDMLEKFFADWTEWPVQIVNIQKSKGTQKILGNKLNIILTDSYESFLEADLIFHTIDNDSNEYYYIFLQQQDDLLSQEIQQIFEYCWQHYLINCVVQTHNNIYTYYPFMAKSCNRVNVIKINEFNLNGTSLAHEVLFSKKLKNLFGCPLNVATWHAPPYMVKERNKNEKWKIKGGIEGDLLMELSQRMNFTLSIRVPDNDEQRGIILRNGSLTGALRMLRNREADFSLGCFGQSLQRSSVATSTINYYQSIFPFIAAEDIYLLTSSQTLLYPFTPNLWILIVSSFFFAIVVMAGTMRIYGNKLTINFSKNTMDILLMFVGMSTLYEPKGMVLRLLNVTWIMYTLLIRTTYQALMFHMIRTHITTDVPQSVEELRQRGYSLVTNRQGVDFLRSVPALDTFEILNLNITSEAMQFMEDITTKKYKNYVLSIPLDFIKYYIRQEHKEETFRIFPYHVMGYRIGIYLTKHSFLIDQFDEILIWIQVSGLTDCWSRKILRRNYPISPKKRKDRVFSLAQLNILFLCMIFCFGVATLVFIFELLYKKVYWRKS